MFTTSRFQKLTLFTAIMTYALVVLGGVVRVTGSGLGCPDWPLCYGQPLPPPQFEAIIEVTHRFLAGFVGILVVLVAVGAWRGYRKEPWVFRPALAGLGLVVVQILLGAITVWLKNAWYSVALHLGTAVALLAFMTMVATAARTPATGTRVSWRHDRLLSWSLASALFVFGLILVGALVTGSGSALACLDWPLCQGQVVPNSTSPFVYIQFAHRLVALITGLVLLYTTSVAWRARAQQHSAWIVAALALSFFIVQATIGGGVVLLRMATVVRGLHLAMAAATWAMTIVLVVLVARSSQAKTANTPESDRTATDRSVDAGAPAVSHARLPLRKVIGAYVHLSKPWIIVLLLVTTFAAMLIAQRGLPPLSLVFFTLLGGALSASSANAINCYIDRDIDVIMNRTRNRPVPAQRIDADHALAYGLMAGVASFVILTLFVNLLSAILATIGLLYYVFIYTGYLKRSTTHNIIIGGVAGAIPPLVGYAAVTGRVDVTALFLFLVIFYWTPPHTWALTLLIRNDYEKAGVPMLPVVRGETETRRQIWLYSLQMVAITLLLFAIQMMGWIYFVAALILNAVFLARAFRLWRLPDTDKALARRLYKYSQSYLALLFLAMVIDKIVIR